MESQKDFENKVTEFIYRLAPMPGNVSELLDHCRVGMQLCKKWNFSQLLQQAVLRHHSPLNDGDFDYLGGIIFTSHFIACSDFTGETLAAMLPLELLGRLELTPEGFVKTQQDYFARRSEN